MAAIHFAPIESEPWHANFRNCFLGRYTSLFSERRVPNNLHPEGRWDTRFDTLVFDSEHE